jgi:hypothetical protein
MFRPAITYSYAIAGRSFCIQASDEWADTLIRHFLRDFHLDSISDPADPDYTIRISSQEQPPAIPAGLETFEVASGHCYRDGYRYYLAVEDSLIVVDPENSLSVWIDSTAVTREPLVLIELLGYALEISLRRSGLFQLHGAGLVPPGSDAGTLILGSSGSGKSTLTARLASRGWSYMTDDALLLNEEDGLINARGIRRFFAASETTLASCSLLHLSEALGRTMLSDPNKRRLEPEVAFPGRFINSCVPRVLFFASISREQRSQVVPLTQTETMSRLIRSNPWATYDRSTAREHLRILSRLLAQCSAYSFHGGLDVLSDPALAERLLQPLIKKAGKTPSSR